VILVDDLGSKGKIREILSKTRPGILSPEIGDHQTAKIPFNLVYLARK